MSSASLCFATRAHICIFLLFPITGIPGTSLFFLADPGPLLAVSAFSRSPLGGANTFYLLSLPITPRVSRECSSSFTIFFLAIVVSFFLSFLLLLCLVPPKLLYDQYPFVGSFYTTLDYAIPSYSSSPFRYFSHRLQPYQPWPATSFSAYSLLHIGILTLVSISFT